MGYDQKKGLDHMFETDLIWKKYKQPKFQNNERPNFETPTWESKVKVSFRCNPHGESHNKLQGGEWCLFPKGYGSCKACVWGCP